MFDYFAGNGIGRIIPIGYYDVNGDGKVPIYKEVAVRDICFDIFERTQSMFQYSGLPETIPARVLELYLQLNGHCAFYKHNGELYVFFGGLGGKPDVYYMPTIYTIANPALNLSVQPEIDKDCVVVSNDSLYRGLSRVVCKYASFLVENEISIKVAQINTRIPALINAGSDRDKDAADKYIKDVYDGKLSSVASEDLFDEIKTQPYSTASGVNNVKSLIELEQYLKASLYNELGLNANFNMKREALNSAESALNDDSLLPLVDDMLRCRRVGLEKVNAMFGTNITVELASSWEDNQIEIEEAQDAINDDTDDISGQPETGDETEDKDGDDDEHTETE